MDNQLYDEIDSLNEENTILKEVRDDLMFENEKQRKEIHRLNKEIQSLKEVN